VNANIPTFTSLAGLQQGEALNETSSDLLQKIAALANAVPPKEMTIARRRELMLEASGLLQVEGLKLPVKSEDIQIPLAGRSLPARLYKPDALTCDVLLVYFHGGGWVLGDLQTHHLCLQFLAQHLGMTVLSVQYRKAPEHVFPAACDDAQEAIAWAQTQLAAWHCKRIAVGGDSAGGQLASIAMHSLTTVDLAGALLFYPVTDMQFANRSYTERGSGMGLTKDAMQWFWQQFLSPQLPLAQLQISSDPRVVPMRQTWTKPPPPTVIIAAWHDPLYDEALSYAQLLAKSGGKVVMQSAPDLSHGFLRQAIVASSARAHALAATHAFRTLLDH
jgi:acetyl esterase